MMKPEFSKPFDIEHAKAGAPFCGSNGEAVRVLIWDRKHPTNPIIAIEEDGNQEAAAFSADGINNSFISSCRVHKLVMLPLGLIDGKPVFVGDEIELKCMAEPNEWKRCTALPAWASTFNDGVARWPAPARDYPQTMMKIADLAKHCCDGRSWTEDARSIANAAIRNAIDAGQVVTMDDHADEVARASIQGQELVHKRNTARDMAIAQAVLSAVDELHTNTLPQGILTAIIATIK